MRAIAPYNVIVATLVLTAAVAGGNAQWTLMVVAAAVLWSSGLFISLEGFRVIASHFAERHALLIIIALGESIVALGAGTGHRDVGFDSASMAVLGLALSACLWWSYFVDQQEIEYALRSASVRERSRVALIVYGYLHFFLLLGIILIASALKTAIPRPFEALPTASAIALAVGTALFLAADDAMTRLLGISRKCLRNAPAVGASLATILAGRVIFAAAQIAMLVAVLAISTAFAAFGYSGKRRTGRNA